MEHAEDRWRRNDYDQHDIIDCDAIWPCERTSAEIVQNWLEKWFDGHVKGEIRVCDRWNKRVKNNVLLVVSSPGPGLLAPNFMPLHASGVPSLLPFHVGSRSTNVAFPT